MTQSKIAIIIPFYREQLSHFEKIALLQCEKVLPGYPKIAIKPIGLSLPAEASALSNLSAINFDDAYFKDVQGYNRLMLSGGFYGSFSEYEYILIHQLDAFVFKDELNYWCGQNYDFIGAPWLRAKEYANFFKKIAHQGIGYFHTRFDIKKKGLPGEKQFINKVGNGGFSLRRVEKFREICVGMQSRIEKYIIRNEHQFNEDAFWAIEVNRRHKMLAVPSYRQAVGFAIESAPGFAFKLNNNELPFGCHAWDRYIDFWRPIFEELGYDI